MRSLPRINARRLDRHRGTPVCPETPSIGKDGVIGNRQGQYPPELRQRAVRLVAESRDEYKSEWAAITSIAAKPRAGSAEKPRK
jgi:hypothetical protein